MTQFEEDKRLVERVDTFGKGLNETERDILETCLLWIEEGRELSSKMRKVIERVDDQKVN